MHPSSIENMQKCQDRFLLPAGFDRQARVAVLDVGGADINGNYRSVFCGSNVDYRTADIAGEHVDIPLTDPYQIPLPADSIDVVVSGQMLEHCAFFWRTFREMVRVLHPDGFLFLIAPSAGPVHRYPVDCYRFYPDAYTALAEYVGCRLEAVWRDERGPWQDLVGVFRKTPLPMRLAEPRAALDQADEPPGSRAPQAPGSAEEERTRGSANYLTALAAVHRALQPRRYLEIGVRRGASLVLADCPAVAVDPAPTLEPLPAAVALFTESSDDFFDLHADAALDPAPDLVFIDGMHLFEYALRDFMQVERRAAPGALVVLDDIFPNHPAQAARERRTRVWAGDVWKLHQCLREHRPDLVLLALDAAPTGLLLIAGLDPDNRVLWERYNPLVRRHRDAPAEPPPAVIAREGALDPADPRITALLGMLRDARDAPRKPPELSARLHEQLRAARAP